MILGFIELLSEASTLLEKNGISIENALSIWGDSIFDAPILHTYAPLLCKLNFAEGGFALNLGLKDMRLLHASADSAQVAMPILDTLHEKLLASMNLGRDKFDWSAIMLVTRELAGLKQSLLIEKCLALKVKAAEEFLSKILQFYPKCEIFNSSEAPFEPLSLKMLEDVLIERGDNDVLAHRDVERLVQKREFETAIYKAEGIKNLVERRSALSSIFHKCCEFGDEQAIKIAIVIAKHPDNTQSKNGLFLNVIEACKKNRRQDLALEAADQIDNPSLKEKYVQKIKYFFGSSI